MRERRKEGGPEGSEVMGKDWSADIQGEVGKLRGKRRNKFSTYWIPLEGNGAVAGRIEAEEGEKC